MTSTDQDDPPEPAPTADQLLPGDAANPTPAHDALSPAAALDHGADALRLLNRSPHPYHRRSVQLHHSHHHSETQSQQQQHPSPSASPTWSSSAASSDNDDSARGGAAAARKGPAPTSYPSQTASRSMSESGTEADDEGYSFVKALPAPPIRPHKGLRDLRGGDAALALSDSGLLTPNQLDEEGRRLSAAPGYFKGRGKGARRQEDGAGEVEVDEEVRKERERYAKRRRAEMLRRGCEVALLAAIGLVVLRGAVALKSLGAWSRELSAYVAVYALLILLYPLRLLFFPQTSRPKDGRPLFRNRIHIPAAFDPAPLLYPAAIPVFVSLSLYPSMEKLLLPNIVLAASALPPLLIPSLAIEAFRDAILPSKETSSQTARRGRRNTLPNPDIGKDTQHSTKTRAKRRKQSYAQSFLALTPTQATIRRWLYAGYTYVAMVLLILVPIRARIAKYALDGQEPFGWAIGYLLGNIRDVRFWVFDWGFDSWISLPPLPDFSPAELSQLSRAEYIRHVLAGGPANTRLFLIGYWMLILIAGMTTVLSLSATVEVDTRRKVFHGMMVAMLLPTAFVDPAFIALTLALVLSVFCLLDLIRAAQLPPLSKPLAYFLTPYVDGRDLRGPVVVSHIFLLIGCAIPLWLSLAGTPRGGEAPWRGWELAAPRDVSMVAGVVCVGMGDAAASLIGRRWGRRKWPWLGGKSLEGSVAFAAAVTVGLHFVAQALQVQTKYQHQY
ncbi:putative phosphatidate cytidylyltransferase protein [Neofusicoccum parvum UCRNP2]|uniref:dolichol kinase n=1 Tax=Botryosphaeria parva (strain UCR-NP2) TaxID=1287680 RepID=R1ES05_BOTPV|nr:putative phosphatidate cytidylyltransferase protein [Neofusicoccum parvum UCRNP2]